MNRITWIIASMSLLLLAACGSKKEEKKSLPGEAAQTYVDYLIKGDYPQFINSFSSIQNLNGDDRKQIEVLLRHYAQVEKEKYGGLKAAEVLKQRISIDGKKAEVTFRFIYQNRQVEETVLGLVWEAGKWKLDMKK